MLRLEVLVRPQWRQGGPATAAAPSQPVVLPDDELQRPKLERHQRVVSVPWGEEPSLLELFSGEQGLSTAARAIGLRTAPGLDIVNGEEFDLSLREQQLEVLSLSAVAVCGMYTSAPHARSGRLR